jgi:hypothetical protein
VRYYKYIDNTTVAQMQHSKVLVNLFGVRVKLAQKAQAAGNTQKAAMHQKAADQIAAKLVAFAQQGN